MIDFIDYFYINPEKTESLFAQLNGQVIQERKERTAKGVKGTGKLGIEIGSILAKLGLAQGTAEAELSSDYSKIMEITTTLALENKLAMLKEFYEKHGLIAQVDLASMGYSDVCDRIRSSRFQVLSGTFSNHNSSEGQDELLSRRKRDATDEPLVSVPILSRNYTANQAINAWSDEDFFPVSILCNCLVKGGDILANPIAGWFRYNYNDDVYPE